MNPQRIYTQQCLDAAYGTEAPQRTGRGRPVSIRVFRSRVIEEVFAKAHPITPIVWFGPLIAYAVYRTAQGGPIAWARGIGLFTAGWLVWTLLEYLLHRYLFHLPAETREQKLRAFLIHGYHHQFPSDPMRLVAPPLMSWPIAVVVGGSYHLALGPGDSWLALFAGTCVGYLAYDWIHYYTHHFHPKWPLGKWLRKYHMLHHFDDDATRYGISSPLWDLVFGTYRSLDARRTANSSGAGPAALGVREQAGR